MEFLGPAIQYNKCKYIDVKYIYIYVYIYIYSRSYTHLYKYLEFGIYTARKSVETATGSYKLILDNRKATTEDGTDERCGAWLV